MTLKLWGQSVIDDLKTMRSKCNSFKWYSPDTGKVKKTSKDRNRMMHRQIKCQTCKLVWFLPFLLSINFHMDFVHDSKMLIKRNIIHKDKSIYW